MRITFFILISLTTISCSHSLYYAYEDENSYCTFEVTKGNNVIYRGKSNKYKEKKYIHIKSSSYEDKKIRLIAGFVLQYLEESNDENVRICFSKFINNDLNTFYTSFVKYNFENKDSLAIETSQDKIFREPCFKKTGITWFPPYLKKIKKIDYKKFRLPYKKKYLRTMNPKHR